MSAAVRLRSTLVAGATAVVIGTGFTLVGLDRRAGDGPSPRSAGAPLVVAAPADTARLLDADAPATASPGGTPATPPTGASTTGAAPTAPRRTDFVKPATRKPDTHPATAPATSRFAVAPPPTTSQTILEAVLADINTARTGAGLPGYTLDVDLSRASALHTQLMIDGCGMQHQCPGEAGIGTRFSAQGVRWTAAGENIGFGSSGSTETAIIATANDLTARMLAEVPPNDGHRRNLLNASFKRVGLSVVRGPDGRVWMTQDFVN